MRDQFGARVIFPQQSSGDDPEVITILGRKEKAMAAEAHIRKLISDLVSALHVVVVLCGAHNMLLVVISGESGRG